MRIIRGLIILVIAILTSLVSQAQNPVLNQYRLGNGFTFSGKHGYEMTLRGYAQPYFETKTYSSDTSGDYYSRFRMRRLRVRLTGDIPQYKIDYRFQVDMSGTSETGDETSNYLMDAWIGYNPTKRIKIRIGQSTDPTDNRELTMGSQTLQLVERSRVTSCFASIRSVGLFAQGSFRTWKGAYIKPYLTINNGDGLNTYNPDHGGFKYGGRIDILPFGLFTYFGQFRQGDIIRELSPKLVFGAAYSKNIGMSSRRGRGGGEIIYLNQAMEESLPDYEKFGIDFLFKYRGFSMLGEFVSSRATVPTDITTRVRNDGSTSNSFEVDGVQDVENYIKGRMMLGKGYNIQMGYILKSLWSFDVRYCYLDADDHSFLNNGTFYNRPKYYTFGVSKYMDRSYGFKIQSSITYVELAEGSNDVYGVPVEGHELIFRLITSFAF